MPEKIVIAEIDIDMDKAIADTIRLRTEEQNLKKLRDEAKKSQGDLSSEYVQYSSQLKATQSDLKSQESLLVKVTQATNAQAGSQDQLKASLSVVTKQWSALSEDERKNTEVGKNLSKQKLDLTNALKKEESATGDTRRNVGNYTEGLHGAVGAATNLVPAIGKASAATELFGNILKVALGPIGLIVAAVVALVSYFKRTEEGQNSLNKVIAVFKVVLENIMDVVGKVGEAIYNAVTKPKEAWEGFKEMIKGVGDFFKNTFGNIIGGAITVMVGNLQAGFANIGLAWQKFKGIFTDNSKKINESQQKVADLNEKIKEGQERVKLGANNLKDDVVSAYNKIKGAITDFIAENQREIDQTKKIQDQKAALRKRERAEIVNDAKDELAIAELRAKAAQKDKLNGEERLALLDKAIAIQNAMMNDDLDIARQKSNIHKQEMAMSDATAEALDEQAKLEADVFKIQQTNAEARRGFEKQRQSAIADMLADLQKEAMARVDNMNYELEKYKLLNESKLKDFAETNRRISEEGVKAEEDRLTAINDKQKEYLKAQLDFKIKEIDQKENESEAAKLAEKQKLNDDYNLAILAGQTDLNNQIHDLNYQFQEQERQNKIEAAQTDYDNMLAIAEDNIFAQLDVQRKQNDLKQQEEIRAAEKTGASVDLINKKYSKANKILYKAEQDAKLSLASGFASNIATIAGENTKVGKAAAVAAATINTYQAATGAYAALAPIPIVGPALGIAAAAAAVISGISNVKKILATQPGSTPSAGSDNAQASQPQLTSSLQSANTDIGAGIVSRNTNNGQASQGSQVQSVLVVDKVTNAQKVESSKADTATI
jgi:hypothetical protein